jgi:glutamate--cysteine ligase
LAYPIPILSEDDLYSMIGSELFRASAGPGVDGVGLELEMFAFIGSQGRYRPVPLRDTEGAGLLDLLERISAGQGWDYSSDDYDNAVVRLPGGGAITLEPAGQIEYSSRVHPTATEALADVARVVGILEREGESAGIRLIAAGYNSYTTGAGPQLQVAKPRYKIMDRHFERIGEYGRQMMRSTCSLQVNLDFGPASIVAERWRLANMIAPSLNALFANSSFNHQGKRYRSFRQEIWRRADSTRTGRLYDRPDLDPVADYLRFALNATVMLVADRLQGCVPAPYPMTFREWISGRFPIGYPNMDDWKLHLSTLFPDVRPRGWMEIRSIDALPVEWQGVPVSLATTLIYNEDLRREALDRLEQRDRTIDPTEHEHGGAWRSDYATGRELLQLALPRIDDPGLAGQAAEYYERFAKRNLTPGDVLVPG